MLSDAAIPCRFTAAVLDKMAGRYQCLQMLLHRVAVCACHIGHLSAIGTTLGPSLGGIMIAFAGWSSIFLINIPLAVFAFVLGWRTLPADAPRDTAARSGFDFAGIALLLVTLCAYALAMTISRGHFGQINIGLIALAIGAGVAFLIIEAKAASPLIRLGMFKAPVFATGIATSALISTVMMATLVVGPFYLSGALHLDPAMLGIVLSAGPLVAALTGVPAGRFVDRFGADRVSIAGLKVVMMGAGALTLILSGFGIAGYVLPIVAMTSGYAVFQAANNTTMMTNALPDQRGVISGLLTPAVIRYCSPRLSYASACIGRMPNSFDLAKAAAGATANEIAGIILPGSDLSEFIT